MSSRGPQDTTRPGWEDNLLDYLSGELAPEEAARFEQSLLECEEHVAMARRYREVIGTLGSVARPADPPAGHKDRFHARLQSAPQERPPRVSESEEAVEARGAGLAVVEGPAAREAPPAIDLAAARRERAQPRWAVAVASMAAALALLFGVWAFIASTTRAPEPLAPGYRAFAIQPQGEYTSTAVVLFNPDTQNAYLYADGLQPLPAGKVYELWLLPAQGGPVAAGVFTGDSAGRATHRHSADRPLREYAGFAVSIEDAPGVTAPAGPIILAGTYQ